MLPFVTLYHLPLTKDHSQLASQVLDSDLNRFLRSWNLTASIAEGVADDPCDGVVGR